MSSYYTRKNILTSAIFVLFIFFLNYNHQIQQGTFVHIFESLADNILSGKGYTYSLFGGENATYPLWGFTLQILPMKIMGITELGSLFINFLFCFIALIYFYRLFKIKFRYWHNLFFIPFYALMSTKTPDAAALSLILPAIFYAQEFIKNNNLKYAVLSGIFFGIILNFRSEYIYFPFFLIIISLFFIKSVPLIKMLKLSLIILIVSLTIMLPWSIRTYSLNGKFLIGASNGGTVAYISLGELQGNRWEIVPKDKSAFDFVANYGLSNPYSIEGDNLLKKEFFRLVKSAPLEYTEKCLNNLVDAITGGLYTGEYSSLFIDKVRYKEIENDISDIVGKVNKLKYVYNLPTYEFISIFFEKLLRAISMVLFFAMILLYLINQRRKLISPELNLLIMSVIIYKFFIVSALQYEYRHMNQIFMFLAGFVLIYHSNYKFFKSKEASP